MKKTIKSWGLPIAVLFALGIEGEVLAQPCTFFESDMATKAAQGVPQFGFGTTKPGVVIDSDDFVMFSITQNLAWGKTFELRSVEDLTGSSGPAAGIVKILRFRGADTLQGALALDAACIQVNPFEFCEANRHVLYNRGNIESQVSVIRACSRSMRDWGRAHGLTGMRPAVP